jgi:hypothetical protein
LLDGLLKPQKWRIVNFGNSDDVERNFFYATAFAPLSADDRALNETLI